AQLQVILQIFADSRFVQHYRYVEVLQLRRRPHTGQKQQLRRADRSGAENHGTAALRPARLAVLPPDDAAGPFAVEPDALDQTPGLEPQIFPMQNRLEKAARRGPASPALLVDVEIAGSLVVAAVEVVDRLDAGLLRRQAELLQQIPSHA